MSLNWRELIGRITGVSTPVFGISWTPPETEVEIARDLLIYLEDRRFLYTPFEDEDAGHIIQSIDQTRDVMTGFLQRAESKSEITKCITTLRAVSRNFMSRVGAESSSAGIALGFEYILALGELRSAFGLQIAIVARAYGLNVADPLVDVLPPKENREDRCS